MSETQEIEMAASERSPVALDTEQTPDHTTWLGLEGARVLVAGAGGIGAACAGAFSAVGARVVLVDADTERATRVLADLGASADTAVAVGADLTERTEARRVVEQIVGRWGGIDVCLHAVGINIRKAALDYTAEEWFKTLDVNLTTAFWLAQEAGARMVAQRGGRIVLVSSVSGLLAHKHHAPYAATKGALNQMMRVMAAEWAGDGVTVNAIAPGYVETDLTREYLDHDGNRERLSSVVPAGRLGTPDELTGPVLFLSSLQARFVTGHVLYVDGGRTLV